MSVSFDFDGEVVVVTGASGSLGGAVAEAFDAAGATVCGVSRSRPEEAVGEFYPADLSDPSETVDAVDAIVADHGRIDSLVTTAGAWRGGTPVTDTELETYRFLLDVNLTTCFLAVKHALPHLRETEGSIVTVGSKSSLSGGRGDALYRAAKAGVRLFTQSVAAEENTVRANTVLPNVLDTPDNREAMPNANRDSWVDPRDAADVVLALCSDATAVTDGAEVPVYGKQ